MRWYQDKRVFISGGSSGIGRATALMLASYGAHVCVGARKQAALEETVAHMRQVALSTTQRLSHVVMDVADGAQVQRVAPDVLGQLGGLDVLINNAGITSPGRAFEVSEEILEQIMRVNFFGTVHVTRALAPTLIAQREGNICNVASVAGFMGVFGHAAYAASKFAVVGYSESLRQELLPHNVHLSMLFPPDTDTPMLHQERPLQPLETAELSKGAGVMQPEDVARAMLEGIRRRRVRIIPGASAKAIHLAVRYAPSWVQWFMDRTIQSVQRSRGG